MTRAQRPTPQAADEPPRPRLFYFNGGFFTQKQVRRILTLSGYDLKLGKPGPDDLVAVWGKSPTSGRGTAVADRTNSRLVHIEDAFLRSVKPGRIGAEPPIGLTIDTQRPYFDSGGPSDLETLLATAPFDDTAVLDRARNAMDLLRYHQISKYSDFDPTIDLPAPGYVLVLDQTKGDAAITHGNADANSFREMLAFAQEEHPGARIIVKSHPETAHGARAGHFDGASLGPDILRLSDAVPSYALLEGAIAVYTVSSTMGFEAVLAGHRPIVFGQPFYAGWGLTDDRNPIDRRQRSLTRAQLFAGAMMLYSKWYDPYRDRLCEIEDVIATLAAQARACREDRQGYEAAGIRLWKRRAIQDFFGRAGAPVRYKQSPSGTAPLLTWANRATPDMSAISVGSGRPLVRVEDGFLRSRGLGAELVAPLSLVADPEGIYYDPAAPSALEDFIAASVQLPKGAIRRAELLRHSIVQQALTKYNLGGEVPSFDTDKTVILVPGQVEDDASVLLGAETVSTNQDLIEVVRAEYPDAFLVFKPHPDVEAGLRAGTLTDSSAADLVTSNADAVALLEQADIVATMTSLMGFEALLRGIPVVCYGVPFYAGWGLTTDKMAMPTRRAARPSLDQLVHAALLDYPRYFDPVTRQPAPAEVIVARLASGILPSAGFRNRALSKLQGLFASHAPLWRR
ncbi:capsular polysaccharide biosynthesis protein [Litoreibacter roseus]|uniref:Capsular polysaccharide biosynthesis protein n=1 Tax=Litoreibacter roseus TaxID=2601869 RepID=A0A6N6JBX3_9RHOB|nr:capsular polysaccharide biosynthesis protein [Litoreibacter roseus]GFE63507.1 capsular polysaccharide biosynthesis protein [Litoreibacter roseus]